MKARNKWLLASCAVFSSLLIANAAGALQLFDSTGGEPGGTPSTPKFSDYIKLNSEAIHYDYENQILTVNAEDPANDPLIFEYVFGTIVHDGAPIIKNASFPNHYSVSLDYCTDINYLYNYQQPDYSCASWKHLDITIKYTGIDNKTKAAVMTEAAGILTNDSSSIKTYSVEDVDFFDLTQQYYYYENSTRTNLLHSGSKNLLSYSRDFNKDLNNSNIRLLLDSRAGDSTLLTQSVNGYGFLYYNDYIYSSYQNVDVKIKKIIYIPQTTTETHEAYAEIAKQRLISFTNNFYGSCSNKEMTKDCTTSDYNRNIYIEYSGEDSTISQDLGVSGLSDYYTIYFDSYSINVAIIKNAVKSNTPNKALKKDVLSGATLEYDYTLNNIKQNFILVPTKNAKTDQIAEEYNISPYIAYYVDVVRCWDHDSGSCTIEGVLKVPVPDFLKNETIVSNRSFGQDGNYLTLYYDNTTYVFGKEKTDEPENPTPTAIDVTEGLYAIRSFTKNNFVFDIAGGSTKNGANAQLYSSNNSAAQKFIIRKNPDNTYRIENLASEKVLDVAGGSTRNGTNVWQYSYNGTCAQKWIFLKNADNSYTIKSSCGDKVLDIAGGAIRNSGNIQIYESNGTAAQKFTLSLIQDLPGEPEISDGFYKIVASSDNTYGITVAQNSLNTGSNIQLGRSNQKESQFAIRHVKDGFYRIANINSLRALDVAGGSGFSGANIQQYDWNGTKAQLWTFKKNSDDSYSIMSRTSLLCADVSGGYIANNVNIQLWACNNTVAQKFNLIAQ